LPIAVSIRPEKQARGFEKTRGRKRSEKSNKNGLEQKIYKNSRFITGNREALGISDAGVKEIEILEPAAGKDLVIRDAEIDAARLGLKRRFMKIPSTRRR